MNIDKTKIKKVRSSKLPSLRQDAKMLKYGVSDKREYIKIFNLLGYDKCIQMYNIKPSKDEKC